MFRHDELAFVVFDVLTLEDRDVRELPLIEKILSRLIPKRSSFILFADHIERRDVISIDSSAPATSSRGRSGRHQALCSAR
jgi:ATP-dependent DNA ligase